LPEFVKGLASPDLLAAADANMIAFWRPYGRAEGSRFESDGNAISFYTGIDYPLFNGVMGTELTVDQIPKLKAFLSGLIADRGSSAIWWIGPQSKPELGVALEGFTYVGDTPAMAADIAAAETPDAIPGFRVERVVESGAQSLWARTAAIGTGLSDETSLSEPSYRAQHRYIGFLDGVPVATSALVMEAGVAGIYGVATAPPARKRGIGRYMTALPLAEARKAGYQIAILQASSMGRPIYERMGFVIVGSYRLYLQAD
jgi:GNAT superfamily N-acetyltransferase